jgi:hypothetical protein
MPRNPIAEQVIAEIEQLQPLVGGTIVAILESQSEQWPIDRDDPSFRTKDGRTLDCWIDCDPEGNGPGHVNISPTE